jgi:Peptidase family M1 domain
MKYFLFFFLFFIGVNNLRAQQAAVDTSLLGEYRANAGRTVVFDLYNKDGKVLLQIVGQGQTEMKQVSGLVYEPIHVRPKATITFEKDSSGRIGLLRWVQDGQTSKWTRINGEPGHYSGNYRLSNNPYQVLHVTEQEGKVMAHVGGDPTTVMEQVTKDRFLLKAPWGAHDVFFKRDKQGQINAVTMHGGDRLDFVKTSGVTPHVSSRSTGFTREDSLQGMLTPLRSCYDVLFYGLDLTILPETRSIRGSNTIRFRVVHDFDRLQVDLHANLKIDRILYHGRELNYTREYNAVYIGLPAMVKEGSVDSLCVVYSGVPLEPDMVNLRGGIFWLWNKEKKMWIESVTQGVGANVYWPCKDHLSDRPDSMRISVTVPTGLSDVSNGRLIERTDLPDGQTRFVWYVDYPIVTYDVVLNIGDYAHYTDVYGSGSDTMTLNFYCMPYSLPFARYLFGDVKRMLGLYEKDFGPYPFRKDGFNLLESIYPMEHQGAVSAGLFYSPFSKDAADTGGIRWTMWHESAHEWWGNSVGCSDYADMWIHESFADYAEFLNNESLVGREAALKHLETDHPENKEPIIGVYNVNHFHMGDMYLKGALLLETLRDVIDNDSLWFSIFRGIQARFRYQAVRTEDIVGYFNTATGTDYTYFFDQYLRHPHIPVLEYYFQNDKDRLSVNYRWAADVPNFHMPLKVIVAKDSLAFVYPTGSWQRMELVKGMIANDFHIDTVSFYVEGRRVEPGH